MSKAGAGLKKAHTKSIKILAWITWVFALAVSAMLPSTFVGDWTRKTFDQVPAPWNIIVPVIAMVLLIVGAFIDIYVDLEPNRLAVYCTMALGVVATLVGGGLANTVTRFAAWMLHMVDQLLFKAAPPGLGSSALAIAVAISVALMAGRVVTKKSHKGS